MQLPIFTACRLTLQSGLTYLNLTRVFEVILLNPTGVAQQVRAINLSEGSNFIADILNAQLQKPFYSVVLKHNGNNFT